MALLDQLYSASFKGVSFLIDSTSTNGGRKTVTHEYPNTDRRFVEDLGELQETFSVNGIIHGANYIQERDALIAALKSSGAGELVHPFFGSVTVTAKPYSLSENLTDLGIARFSMVFEKSDKPVGPVKSLDNSSSISGKINSLTSKLKTDISKIFSIRKKFPSNFLSAKGILTTMTDKMGINADNILKIADEANSFSGFVTGFTRDIGTLINDPTRLADEFTTLFRSFGQIGRNAEDQIDLLSTLFNYGSGDTATAQTTIPRIERETNRQIINSAINTSALMYAYNTIPQISFVTESEIKETRDLLDGQFQYIMQNNNLTDPVIQEIKNLRVEVSEFLETAEVNAYKISSITTHEIPMTILCYNYYGSVDKTNDLLNLNDTIDASFVEGSVNILTS